MNLNLNQYNDNDDFGTCKKWWRRRRKTCTKKKIYSFVVVVFFSFEISLENFILMQLNILFFSTI